MYIGTFQTNNGNGVWHLFEIDHDIVDLSLVDPGFART